jgi:adenosylcobinamide kinase/adenosylcobinamide-phosphate guanylyltransferase
MNSDRSSLQRIILVTGAASSGKSEWAETLAKKTEQSVIYLATAQVDCKDREWLAKIEKHRQRRPSNWQILEVPFNLTEAIELACEDCCLLVDSLGTWVANLLDIKQDHWEETSKTLLKNLQTSSGKIILVAEETGWGVVPGYEAGRLFRDRLGKLIREIGIISDEAYLVTGGHALDLKKLGNPLSTSDF